MTLKIYHNDWFLNVVEGDSVTPMDTQTAAHQAAKARGYRFQKVEHVNGRAVETWVRRWS